MPSWQLLLRYHRHSLRPVYTFCPIRRVCEPFIALDHKCHSLMPSLDVPPSLNSFNSFPFFNAGASSSPEACPPGTFCRPVSSKPESCPSSFFCRAQSHAPSPCESGYYCPKGEPKRCGVGGEGEKGERDWLTDRRCAKWNSFCVALSALTP